MNLWQRFLAAVFGLNPERNDGPNVVHMSGAEARKTVAKAIVGPSLIAAVEPKAIPFEPSPNYQHGGAIARKIELVILHATAGGFAGAVKWLRDGVRPKPTSAHYVIAKDGRIVQLVAENDIAWHAGVGKWKDQVHLNTASVGIELENDNTGHDPYPKAQLEACMWLTLRTCKRHNIAAEDVVGHADVAPGRKTDPAGFPFFDFRASLRCHLLDYPGGTTA